MKNELIQTRFKIEPFDYDVKIYVYNMDMAEKLAQSLNEDMNRDDLREENLMVQGSVYGKPDEDMAFIIFNTDFISYPLIVHELTHLVDNIWSYFNLNTKIQLTELRARVSEYIFEKITEWLKLEQVEMVK